MENASKALIMAGSILIALLVIGLLVFGFNEISDVEQAKEDADEIDKMAEYMSRFEQFNRGKDNPLYGSELLSLANLQEDYNVSDARVDSGYDKIQITVEIKDTIDENYFQKGSYDLSKIVEDRDKLLEERAKYEEPNSKYNNKSVKYYSKKSYREIAKDFAKDIKDELKKQYGVTEIPSNWGNDMISGFLETHPKTQPLMQDIQNYASLNAIYNEFRTGKKFYCSNSEYHRYNGRLTSMTFTEI